MSSTTVAAESGHGPLKSACDRCTASKVACDGKRPCGRCAKLVTTSGPAQSGDTCIYSAPKKRGPQPGFKRKRTEDGEPEHADGQGSSSQAAGHPGSHWLHSLFWPRRFNGPLNPSSAELGYIQSFFAQARTVMPIIDESAFYAALREAGTWATNGIDRDSPEYRMAAAAMGGAAPLPPVPVAPLPVGQPGSEDLVTAASGFALLYYVVLGLGSAMQGKRLDSLLYLQRASAQIGPVLVVPSETAAIGIALLALATSRIHPDAYRAQCLMAAADGVLTSMIRAGRNVSISTRVFVTLHYRSMWHPVGERIVAPVPLPPDQYTSSPGYSASWAYLDPLARTLEVLWFTYVETMYGLKGRPSQGNGSASSNSGSSGAGASSSSAGAGRRGPSSSSSAVGAGAGASSSSAGPAIPSYTSKPDSSLVSSLMACVAELEASPSITSAELKYAQLRTFIHLCEVVVRLAGEMSLPERLLLVCEAEVRAAISHAAIVATPMAVLCGRMLAQVAEIGLPKASATVEGSGQLMPLLQAAALALERHPGLRLPEQELLMGIDERTLVDGASAGLAALAEASVDLQGTAFAAGLRREPHEFSRACHKALADGAQAAKELGLVTPTQAAAAAAAASVPVAPLPSPTGMGAFSAVGAGTAAGAAVPKRRASSLTHGGGLSHGAGAVPQPSHAMSSMPMAAGSSSSSTGQAALAGFWPGYGQGMAMQGALGHGLGAALGVNSAHAGMSGLPGSMSLGMAQAGAGALPGHGQIPGDGMVPGMLMAGAGPRASSPSSRAMGGMSGMGAMGGPSSAWMGGAMAGPANMGLHGLQHIVPGGPMQAGGLPIDLGLSDLLG